MLCAARNTSSQLGANVTSRAAWLLISRGKGQQFEYSYDDIGNRTQTRSGGDSLGGNLRTAIYQNSHLNQVTRPMRWTRSGVLWLSGGYGSNERTAIFDQLSHGASRVVPGTVDVIGTAFPGATVTVNSQATSRKGEYFHAEVPVNNSVTNAYQAISVSVSQTPASASSNGNIFLPHNPEILKYDPDGNLTNDGRWVLTWDGENRLIRMTSTNVVDAAKKTVVFNYDWRGRRVSKTVSNYVGGVWQAAPTQKFIYDGWNLVGMLGGLPRFFTHGTDLSGTLQGAGGVGGLLAVLEQGVSGSSNYCFAYDGNGNVAGLVSAHNGTITAQYEYDPFGNLLRSTGPKAAMNPMRFSSKFQDEESGWSYYGYRYYAPGIGKWVSRDPIEERDGPSLYAFVHNSAPNLFDRNGRESMGVYYDRNGNWNYPHGLPKPVIPPSEPDIVSSPPLPLKFGLPRPDPCCSQNEIQRQKQLLISEYAQSFAYLKARGVPHRSNNENYSCVSINGEMCRQLNQVQAPCWDCRIERRSRYQHWGPPFIGDLFRARPNTWYDHWIVICRAKTRVREEISFDYWANRPPGEDPNIFFRERFPTLGFPEDGENDNSSDAIEERPPVGSGNQLKGVPRGR